MESRNDAMVVVLTISSEVASQMMKTNERNFGAKDMPSIMAGYTDDVVVRYADFPEIRGKARLEEFLRARFTRMQNYRLTKTLDAVYEDTIVNSWEGHWQDAKTSKQMEGRGIEVWRVTPEGKCSYWSAAFNVWEDGKVGTLPII
jgi:nuclear transport factor 2 (NTF2) superfamily protein